MKSSRQGFSNLITLEFVPLLVWTGQTEWDDIHGINEIDKSITNAAIIGDGISGSEGVTYYDESSFGGVYKTDFCL